MKVQSSSVETLRLSPGWLFGLVGSAVLLRYVLVPPSGDVLGNLGVARMVEGRFFGDFWENGWFHRPIGYRLVLFPVVKAIDRLVSIRSAEGIALFNFVTLFGFGALFWATAGTFRRTRLLRFPLV
ncbi:MAG: hypothetical protein MK135_13715, partial [Polyangiaceae bacterium]|nr:hypothetical protein [Polyangiaceae bacterium]